MRELAIVVAGQGKRVFGVQIHAMASVLRATMGTPVRPMVRLSVEQALVAARSTLSGELAAAASAAGFALVPEEIVARIA